MSDLKRHLWFLSKTPALAALPPAARTQIASATDLRERPRKTCLYRAGEVADHVYCLHGGRVTALRAAEGSRAVTLGIYGPGDVFGESCLWNPSPREHDAVASTSVLYAAIPRALLRLLLDEHPAAALLLAEQAIARRELVIRRLSVAMSTSVRARLADQLLALAEFGSDLPEGRALALSLTHHELAALIGTTRETVSVELQRLRREGLVLTRRRQIVLRDLPRLRAQARDCSTRAPPRTRAPGLARAPASLASRALHAP